MWHAYGVGTDAARDVLAKLGQLRQHQRDTQISPHKPLLLLLALGLLEKNGSSELPWSVAEVKLADLIARFASPAKAGAAQRAAYPFTHLRADGLWELDRDVVMDSVRELNAKQVTGKLEPTIEAAFRADPALVHEAARMLVTGSFPETIAPDVLDAVGLDATVVLGSEVSRSDVYHKEVHNLHNLHNPRRSRGAAQLDDYLNLTMSAACSQFRMLLERKPVSSGRQAIFLPTETLLCLAASFVVNHWSYGGANAHSAPEPVPKLAHLFSRTPSSILAKMANLDGSRQHGAKWDASAGAALREQPILFTHIYRVLLQAARAEGIGPDRLPDFLDLEGGGEFALLGQDELGPSEIDDLRAEIEADGDSSETERIMLAAVRAGQHVFALNVLRNCGGRCAFCGLNPSTFGARRMLIAGHIKPWRDSTHRERLDIRNGLAACPAHDVAFDTGLITVDDELHIYVADSLTEVMQTDHVARQYYGQPPLLGVLILPRDAQLPNPKYLDWHRQHVFVGRRS
jgi:putative restriction endonuclease